MPLIPNLKVGFEDIDGGCTSVRVTQDNFGTNKASWKWSTFNNSDKIKLFVLPIVLIHYKNTLTSLYILTERNVAVCSNLVGAWHTKTGQLTFATPSFQLLSLIIIILFSFLPALLGSPDFLNHLNKQVYSLKEVFCRCQKLVITF